MTPSAAVSVEPSPSAPRHNQVIVNTGDDQKGEAR
jgi:hypothetical protein